MGHPDAGAVSLALVARVAGTFFEGSCGGLIRLRRRICPSP
ncbi:hypothetical protein Q1M63_09880 (plasmid) [Sinorhizobium meliloti]|nr:hypothetical protein Q1M63_09880 [Sinorhizobium meliloti]